MSFAHLTAGCAGTPVASPSGQGVTITAGEDITVIPYVCPTCNGQHFYIVGITPDTGAPVS